jgi:DNA-binding HxlR family transcriptional regulator
MLSQTLRSLVSDGLISRTVNPTVAPQVSYGLTDLGRSLEIPLSVLRSWAEENTSTVKHNRQIASLD